MTDLSNYFFDTSADIEWLDLVRISHPDFGQTYRLVKQMRDGVTVDLSGEEPGVAFTFAPIDITPAGSRDDSNAAIEIQLGDVGEIIATELDNVAEANGFLTRPTLEYWAYRADTLDAPLEGPLTFEIADIDMDVDGASFEARAPRLNEKASGETYSLDRFTPLRGFF